ncbi:LacI family transcriptional regulator [bacterium]|nr:MAG: LacI family transcriptional regulator [bacterium]
MGLARFRILRASLSFMRSNQNEDNRSKPVTIVDVAQAAGVTSMTVSRVMKGYKHVSPKTREKVLRVAQEMKYTVNLAARALVTGQTGIIAVISERLDNPYYANLVHHLELQLETNGYVMRLLHTDEELDSLINSTNSSAIDGVIVAGLFHRIKEFLRTGPERAQPCVFVNTSVHSEADFVHLDLEPALTKAIGIMVRDGRQRIAHIGMGALEFPHPITDLEDRILTYLSEMKKLGRKIELIGVNPSVTIDSPARIEALKEYFQSNGCPDGLVCFNDAIALHVFRALSDLGLSIPEDVMLVGCDDLPFMKFFEPPLSSIAPPIEEASALAWQFLQARMLNPAIPRQQATLDAELVLRKSLQT